MTISEKQVRRSQEDGFTTIESLVDSETLSQLRELYDQFIDGKIDCGNEYGKYLGGTTRHVMEPHMHHSYFRDNPALSAARKIARELSDYRNPELTYDMLITKPP